ncbi:hypothetical protein [Halalkalibacter urbisdiaboli]|uniref:hypothetical protein n=1 Tax=Halalkalibacter urbisdiaboli TaxID=1960589 RepID=UPI0013FD9528|nr:hypothetical protein [Halalkalibacter urbisdiaboli]
MNRFVLFWRISVIVIIVMLFLTKVINQFIFYSFLFGILVFYGIPWLYAKVKKK